MVPYLSKTPLVKQFCPGTRARAHVPGVYTRVHHPVHLILGGGGVGGGVQNRGRVGGGTEMGVEGGGGSKTPKKGVRKGSGRTPPTLSGGGVLIYHRSVCKKVDHFSYILVYRMCANAHKCAQMHTNVYTRTHKSVQMHTNVHKCAQMCAQCVHKCAQLCTVCTHGVCKRGHGS